MKGKRIKYLVSLFFQGSQALANVWIFLQLICIARALINKPDIFILDEATSLIDPITENQIKIGLKNLKNKFTMIIIAHRLSTITHADKIIFLEHGKIIEQGTHSILLKRKGRYYDLYMKQFQDKIEQKIELLAD